jgi:hypothetical protein
MIQLGRGLGFTEKAGLDFAAKGQLGWEDLDRHDTLESAVLGAVHDAHPAPADFAVQFVVRAKGALDQST